MLLKSMTMSRVYSQMFSKRRKFVITSLALSLGFLIINFLDNQYRFWFIGGLTVLTILLFVWSLIEGLSFDATLLTLVLPGLYTLGVGLFWFLLPSTIFARIPIVILYGMGIYALCSTANIYTVSAVRAIALARAAKGVGFVLTLVTTFLIFDAILSLRAPIWVSVPLTVLSSFPIYLQGLWTSSLEKRLEKNILTDAILFSLGMGEISLLLYFWPVTVVVGSIFLTIGMYMLLGLGQANFEGRLFKATIREYLTIGIVVFIAMLFAPRWGG